MIDKAIKISLGNDSFCRNRREDENKHVDFLSTIYGSRFGINKPSLIIDRKLCRHFIGENHVKSSMDAFFILVQNKNNLRKSNPISIYRKIKISRMNRISSNIFALNIYRIIIISLLIIIGDAYGFIADLNLNTHNSINSTVESKKKIRITVSEIGNSKLIALLKVLIVQKLLIISWISHQDGAGG